MIKKPHGKGQKSGYIFTNKDIPHKGIMSTILGVISLISLGMAIFFTYKLRGQAPIRYGAVGMLAMLFSIGGLVLGIRSRLDKDKYYFFSNAGIVCNVLVLFAILVILLIGVIGL